MFKKDSLAISMPSLVIILTLVLVLTMVTSLTHVPNCDAVGFEPSPDPHPSRSLLPSPPLAKMT